MTVKAQIWAGISGTLILWGSALAAFAILAFCIRFPFLFLIMLTTWAILRITR
jgi:hypothetical protein